MWGGIGVLFLGVLPPLLWVWSSELHIAPKHRALNPGTGQLSMVRVRVSIGWMSAPKRNKAALAEPCPSSQDKCKPQPRRHVSFKEASVVLGAAATRLE